MAEHVIGSISCYDGNPVVEIIGEGDFVPDGDEERFVGQVVGYRWRAKNRAGLDRFDFEWKELGVRQPTETRTGVSGERRIPVQRDPDAVRLDVVKRPIRER